MSQKVITECDGCGLGYHKPWYEPMWLARKNWAEAHEGYHGNSQRDYGRELERERIMTIITKFHASKTHHLNASCWVCDLITELEGEK